MLSRARHWIAARLGRKLGLSLGASMAVASLIFLIAFVALYQGRLLDERARASEQVNLLLQASLENAMLKRDLDGLREVVARLGAQEGVRNVMILNPDAEVRFSSEPEQIGRRFDIQRESTCAVCHAAADGAMAVTAFLDDERGAPVLRSVNVVRNREPCTECHGAIETNPVNGVLLVDYDAAGVKQQAFHGALALGGSGAIVLALSVLGIGLLVHRFVLQPVSALTTASEELSHGRLGARVNWRGDDELAQLADSFNIMADRVQSSVDDLADREQFLQSLIDSVPDGIRVVDQDYRIVRANRAYCGQLGCAMDDVVGKPCYRSSHGRDEPCAPTLVTCPLVELQGDARAIKCLHRHIKADGDEVFVEVTAARVSQGNAPGRQWLMVEAIRDLDQQMRLSHEQRLSEIGQLAAGVAHEVRNPLTSIRFGLDAIQKGMGDDGAGRVKEYIDVVNQEIAKCLGVTERLLRLSLPASDRPELVSLNDVVADIVALMSFEAEKAAITIQLDLDDDLRVLATDSEMRMTVLNLVQNAFHVMTRGGSLDIEGRYRDGEVILTFRDTGVGIRPADIPMIFQPFWSRRADGIEGTGLGLAISRAILRRWGGDIAVASKYGEGSAFSVRLPHADTRGV